MALLLLTSLLALAPGRYAGEAPAGLVWLWLEADGRARFGGAEYRWRQAADRLYLDAEAPLVLRVVTRSGRTCLLGPPFETVCLRAAPLGPPKPIPKRARPAPLVGRWRHTATGGRLDLQLGADGRYLMLQAATGDAAERTSGRWFGSDATLSLTPDGGATLTYRARRAGSALLIEGGDLPMAVRFERVDAAPGR